MSEPTRVRLSRAKGWRKPENTVVVSRPSRWGNPFRVGDMLYDFQDEGFEVRVETRAQAVELFELHVGPFGMFELDVAEVRRALAGKNLACWCPLDQPCHADVLLELANGGSA